MSCYESFVFFFRPKKRKGFCKTLPECRNGMVYWPQDTNCYALHTRGPCPKGKLFVMGKNRLPECKVFVTFFRMENFNILSKREPNANELIHFILFDFDFDCNFSVKM